MNKSEIYVAFLRGINVGGNSLIKMKDLQKTFENFDGKNVHTILTSGNVIFETQQKHSNTLLVGVEENLKATLHREVTVFLRSKQDMENLIAANPFKTIHMSPRTRLYVTFAFETPQSSLPIPYESPEKDCKIVQIIGRDICSVIEISANHGSTDLMRVIEKEFGKKVTTRNWNTIIKVMHVVDALSR